MLDAQRAMPIQWTVTNFGRVSVEEGCRKAKLGVYKGFAVTRPKYLHELGRGQNNNHNNNRLVILPLSYRQE